MTMAPTVQRHLAREGVPYETVSHPATGSSSWTAQTAHVSGNRIAKAVLLRDNGGYLLAVVPASHHLRPEWLEQLFGIKASLASEQEAGRLFLDCDVGAIPPLGDAYGLDVVLDEALLGLERVGFEGGDHRTLVEVSGETFAKLLAGARRGTISAHD